MYSITFGTAPSGSVPAERERQIEQPPAPARATTAVAHPHALPVERDQDDREQLDRDRNHECDRRAHAAVRCSASTPTTAIHSDAERVDVAAVRDLEDDERIPRVGERRATANGRCHAATRAAPRSSADRTRPAPASSARDESAMLTMPRKNSCAAAGYGVRAWMLGISRVSSVWVHATAGSVGHDQKRVDSRASARARPSGSGPCRFVGRPTRRRERDPERHGQQERYEQQATRAVQRERRPSAVAAAVHRRHRGRRCN